MITVGQVNDFLIHSGETVLWEVVHATPGRIRARLAWLQDYPSLHQTLEEALTDLGWVNLVSLNPIINSLTVHYDAQSISHEEMLPQLREILWQVTPTGWLSAKLEAALAASSPAVTKIDSMAPVDPWLGAVEEMWNQSKPTILTGVGVASLAIGVVLVPLPLIPGWPLLILGTYCLKLAGQE